MNKNHYNSTALSTKDEGPDAIVLQKIAAMGDDVKELKGQMQSDIAAARAIAEEAKCQDGAIDEKLNRATQEILAKHEALEQILTKQTERGDLLETMLKRNQNGGAGSPSNDMVAEACDFFSAKMAAKGTLNWNNAPDADSVDTEGFTLWSKHFNDYIRIDERGMNTPDQAKALSVGSNPNGGYLVPTAQSSRIITRVWESSPLRRLASVESIGTDSLEIPVDIDEFDAGWVGEEQQRPETANGQVGLMTIPVHELYAKPKVTQKFLEDAAIDASAWIEGKAGDKFGRIEARSFIRGNGVKKPRGILTYDRAVMSPENDNVARGTIRQLDSGLADKITADAIVSMPFQLKDRYLSNASWLMKRSSVLAVMLLKDANDQYLWNSALSEKGKMTLGGYGVEMADDMPVAAANALPIAFGDFRAGYTVVDRLGITLIRDAFSSKPFVEFYMRKRVGGDVTDFEAFALMRVGVAA